MYGDAWELCWGVHAEIVALLDARESSRLVDPFEPHDLKDSPQSLRYASAHILSTPEGLKSFLERFTPEDREKIKGSSVFLMGILHSCDICQKVLAELDVQEVVMGAPNSEEVRRRYNL